MYHLKIQSHKYLQKNTKKLLQASTIKKMCYVVVDWAAVGVVVFKPDLIDC